MKWHESEDREKVLDMALNLLAYEENESAIDICIEYCFLMTPDLDHEKIAKAVNELIVSKMLSRLAEKGLVEVSFDEDEPKYRLTKEGETNLDNI
jgi:predicted transcriptional regulator